MVSVSTWPRLCEKENFFLLHSHEKFSICVELAFFVFCFRYHHIQFAKIKYGFYKNWYVFLFTMKVGVIKLSFSMGIFLFSISRLKLGFVLDKEHIFSFRLIPFKKDHTKTSITPNHTLSLLFYGNYKLPSDCKISSWLALPQNCALTHTHLHNSITLTHLHFHNRVGRRCLA